MFGQGLGPLQGAFHALAVGLERAAAAGLGPVHRAAGLIALGGGHGGFVAAPACVRINILGAHVVFGHGGAVADLVGGGLAEIGRGLGFTLRLDLGRAFLTLQQGVPFEHAFQIGVQLDARQLQQLDRLLQLRRDDQTLALSQL